MDGIDYQRHGKWGGDPPGPVEWKGPRTVLPNLHEWTRAMEVWGHTVAKSCVELNRELIQLRKRVDELERKL